MKQMGQLNDESHILWKSPSVFSRDALLMLACSKLRRNLRYSEEESRQEQFVARPSGSAYGVVGLSERVHSSPFPQNEQWGPGVSDPSLASQAYTPEVSRAENWVVARILNLPAPMDRI